MTGVKQYLHRYSKDSSLKVVFGDNSSGDTDGYGLVNCNGITFTRVAYVNGLKHNLISINQLCDANFKVLFTKTQGTIFNQNNEVVLIAPRRRDVYVIDMSSYNEESNACFFAKASNNVNWLWHKRLSYLNFKNINKLARQNLVAVAKVFRVFNIKRPKKKETYHVTFSEDDVEISKSSTEGDEINFNENRSFLDDVFFIPRNNVSQCSENDSYFPYVLTYDPLSSINITIPDPITPSDLITSFAGVTTRSQIRDSKAASVDKCLFVNFLSEMEPKKLIEALEEEGWIIAMQEELNQFERNKV
ncbi:retrovirus-related pol polyprotein from transposon TNT 1-94 [Tanacetum coccineum]|uniref:Retrovirus-related pol polyprotein from transposon TNT 1-94 n=1 Tax=Tanacetum coccineum TaxID=301880 RepID=A0ABQ5IZH8_9ASTR